MKMRRPLSVLAAVAALYAHGCIGNNASLTIIGMTVPDTGCQITAGGLNLSEIVVDLTVAKQAIVAPIVRNNLLPTPTGAVTGDVHTFLIEGANVKFRSNTATKLTERFVSGLGSVPAGAETAIGFEILSRRDIDVLRGDPNITNVIANLKVSGRLTDGGSITTTEVPVSIRLCRGCLEDPRPALGCCASVEPLCATNPALMEIPRKVVCNVGEFETTDFCTYEERRR